MPNISILKKHSKVFANGDQKYWLYYRNNSNKTIKYLYVTVSFFNAVGDCIGTEEYKCTGPCESGAVKYDTLDFSKYIQMYRDCKFKIREIDIEYMDGEFVENCEWEYDEDSTLGETNVIRIIIGVCAVIFIIGICLIFSSN